MQALVLSPVSRSRQPSMEEVDQIDPQQVKNLMTKIDSINLDPITSKLVRELSWSSDQVSQNILMYRRFLALQFLFPDAKVVPTKEVDEVWHRHILYTRLYMQECKRVFGYFVHHQPSSGTPDDKEDLKSQFASTAAIYSRIFSEPYGNHAECGNCCDGGSGCHSCSH